MNDLDRIAQQFPNDGDRPLADYFVALLPCQLLLVDALAIERRRLPTPTEFVLKAIQSEITKADDIAGLLGMTKSYTERLIQGLVEDLFVTRDESGRLRLTLKGQNVISMDGERRPIDKTVPVLWDPVLQCPIRARPKSLYTQSAADKLGPIWKMPNIFKQPNLDEMAVADSERFANSVQEEGAAKDPTEIIRFLSIKKCLFRYRQSVVLIYEKENAAPIFKVAVDGHIDEALSTALAQRDGGKFIGIDTSFTRKAGALAVKERFKLLKLDGGDSDAPVEITELMRRKSALLLSITVLQERLTEEPSENLEQKLRERMNELLEIESVLKRAKVVPLMQFEIGLVLASALETTEDLVITTTLPTAEKFTVTLQKKFEKFLSNGGSARIYIAGRSEDAAKRDDEARLLALLKRLQESHPKLSVQFLKRMQRPVFEIRSGDRITFSNEPPLGRRSGEFAPRAFRGYQVGHPTSVASYSSAHLAFTQEDVLAQVLEKSRKNTPR